VSYNHLGNNDGMNLSAPQTFRSKEISKSNVVDDMVASNAILYEPGEHPDHVVVIKVSICAFSDTKIMHPGHLTRYNSSTRYPCTIIMPVMNAYAYYHEMQHINIT
jgi:hypothetical protein